MRGRWLVLLLPALVLIAGCGRGSLQKATYPRTAIPGTAPERLSADGLRLMDPCGLLDRSLLAKFGLPDDNGAQDYDGCHNYMKDGNGKSLYFSVRVGQSVTRFTAEEATERVAGFKAARNTVEGACFLTLLVEEPEPDLAVELQVGYSAGDPCRPGREVAESIGRRLHGAPLRTPEKGSLLPLDPCALGKDLAAQALPGAGQPDPFGLHKCTWGVGGTEIDLRFAQRYDPARNTGSDAGEPVDLGGGVSARQRLRTDVFPVCELEWLHRKITDEAGDVVQVEVRDVRRKGVDVCGTAAGFAQGLLGNLPTP